MKLLHNRIFNNLLLFMLITLSLVKHVYAEAQAPPACVANELCGRYYQVWKRQIMKNEMSDEYFRQHFDILFAKTTILEGRISFTIRYLFKIDWASITRYDNIDVSLANPDIMLYNNAIPIMPINKLKYSNQNDAMKALQAVANRRD